VGRSWTVLRWARDSGAAEAQLDVNEENDAAVTRCREAGFTETEGRQSLRERASASTVSMQRAYEQRDPSGAPRRPHRPSCYGLPRPRPIDR
jgi:hypothetical protein